MALGVNWLASPYRYGVQVYFLVASSAWTVRGLLQSILHGGHSPGLLTLGVWETVVGVGCSLTNLGMLV